MAMHPIKDLAASALLYQRADFFVFLDGTADPVFTVHCHARHSLERVGVLFKGLVEPRVVHLNDQQTMELIVELIEIILLNVSCMALALQSQIFVKKRKQLHCFRFILMAGIVGEAKHSIAVRI